MDSLAGLDTFLDERAAYIAQHCVFEYSRARAGLAWQKLFDEPLFLEALERSRWISYTATFCDVAEMVYGRLLPHWPLPAGELAAALAARGKGVFARYPLPDAAPDDFWRSAGERLDHDLAFAALGAPKPVNQIPLARVEIVFDNLPVHESLRGHDRMLVQNNLRTGLVGVHDTFVARAEPETLAGLLVEWWQSRSRDDDSGQPADDPL